MKNSTKTDQLDCIKILNLCSADEWIKKMWYIYVYVYMYVHTHTHTHKHNGILLSHKKEGNFAICNNMDGLRGHYAKWNKSDRERQLLYDITYM